jgi:hypothetical protein
VRTPSKEKEGSSSHAVVFTSRTEISMVGVVEDDKRADIEVDLKRDKHGLGLSGIHKRRLADQIFVVLSVG